MKILEKLFQVNSGGYSGFLIKESLAKKLAKLLYKQEQEIKHLIANNLEDVYVEHWSIVYPYGKQTSFYYIDDQNFKEDKLKRLELFNKQNYIRYIPNVFKVSGEYSTSSKLAEKEALEYFESLIEEDKQNEPTE